MSESNTPGLSPQGDVRKAKRLDTSQTLRADGTPTVKVARAVNVGPLAAKSLPAKPKKVATDDPFNTGGVQKGRGVDVNELVALQNLLQEEIVRLKEEVQELEDQNTKIRQVQVRSLSEMEERALAAEKMLADVRHYFYLFGLVVDKLIVKLPDDTIDEFLDTDDGAFYQRIMRMICDEMTPEQ